MTSRLGQRGLGTTAGDVSDVTREQCGWKGGAEWGSLTPSDDTVISSRISGCIRCTSVRSAGNGFNEYRPLVRNGIKILTELPAREVSTEKLEKP